MRTLLIALCVLTPLAAQSVEESRAGALEELVENIAAEVTPAFVFIGGGSGVLISPDGYMLTNHHVAGGQARWTVFLTGGRQYTAEVVGNDSWGDITLLKLEGASDLPYVELGSSDDLSLGEYVFAVGNPFALGNQDFEPTVTLGVVSAIHRYYANYSDAIQTDTSINPGNSGGPLFTMEGELVGINGMISTRFGARVNSGVGFAIPSAQIERFLPRLKAAGGAEVRHGRIDGLDLEDAGDGRGALVAAVRRRSNAARAGFQRGDRLIAVGDYPIVNARRAEGFILSWPAGSTVALTVDRDGAEEVLEVTLDARGRAATSGNPERVRLGVFLEQRDGAVVVDRVQEGSAAASAGFQAGDKLLVLDGQRLRTRADLLEVLDALRPGDSVGAVVERDGREKELTVAFPE